MSSLLSLEFCREARGDIPFSGKHRPAILYRITYSATARVFSIKMRKKKVWGSVHCLVSVLSTTLMSNAELLHDNGTLGRKKAINMFSQ